MHESDLRASLERLQSRLARIGAAASTLRQLTPGLDEPHAPRDLVDALTTLDHDLALAARDVDDAQRHAIRELESLTGASERMGSETT